MDGRWKISIAGSVILSGVIGCTSTKSSLPDTPPPPPTGKNSVYVPEPADEGVKKDGPLACSTLVLFGNMWVEMVAKDPNKPAAERDTLLSKARRVYMDVLQREPKNVDALIGLGEMYKVTGESDKLLEVEKKAMALHPQNPNVWAWVAKQQAQAKNFDAAADSYQHALKYDPENRTYRIHLGFTLARGGHYVEGYECLSRAMHEAEARFNLAQMMLHNGETEKARTELRLCLKADPNMKAADDLLASLTNGGPGLPTATH